ncbi:MAG: hypothetical protein HY660_14420 [Armatimonadetes bacterium]|nr:hypothetical protein [Armatimonadota bacterium]
MQPRRGERGLALVVVLVIAVVLTAMGVAMTEYALSEISVSSSGRYVQSARYLADAGVAYAINQIKGSTGWTGPATKSYGEGSFTVSANWVTMSQAIITSTGTAGSASQTAWRGPQAGWRFTAASLGLLPNVARMALLAQGLPQEVTAYQGVFTVPASFGFTVFSEQDVVVQHGGANDVVRVLMTETPLGGFGAIYARYDASSSRAAIEVKATKQNGVYVLGALETPKGASTCGASGNKACIDVDAFVKWEGRVSISGTTFPSGFEKGRSIPFPTYNFDAYRSLAQSYGTYPNCRANVGCYFGGSKAGDDFEAYVDANGGNLTGLFFIEDATVELKGKKTGPNQGQLTLNGSIIVYKLDGSQVKGRLKIKSGATTLLAGGADPVLLTGGSICADNVGTGGPLTITGVVAARAADSETGGDGCGDKGIKLDAAKFPYTVNGMLQSKGSIILRASGTVRYNRVAIDKLPPTFNASSRIYTPPTTPSNTVIR